MKRHELKIFADYHTLYLMDDEVSPAIPEKVTDDDTRARLKAAPHIVVVYSARDEEVPVTVEVHEAAPREDLDRWDHVAEATLDVPSGRVVVAGCADYLPKCARVAVKPGAHRVRVSYGGLADEDHYRIALWPAPPGGLRVLKQAS